MTHFPKDVKDEIWMNYGNKIKEGKFTAITNGLKCNKLKVLIFFPESTIDMRKLSVISLLSLYPHRGEYLCQEGAAEDKSSTEKVILKHKPR